MKTMKIFSILLISTMVGCAGTSTGVIPIGKDTYLLATSQSAGTGIKNGAEFKAKAIIEGSEFCKSLGKIFQITSASQNDSAVFVLAKAEIQFLCLDKNDPQLVRPTLNQQANQIIEVRKEIGIQDKTKKTDLYNELLKLDDLLKKGILTEAEFQAQKRQLLAD